MTKIVFTPPSPDAPGFLRRMKTATQLMNTLVAPDALQTISPDVFDHMVEFLADFVSEPSPREKAIEALWDASESQFKEMLTSVTGAKDAKSPFVQKSGEKSANG